MSKFYPLKIAKVNRETADTVSVELEIPAELKSSFTYKQGQYLTFKSVMNGQEVRRSYSICSSPYNGEALKVAVKEVPNGLFSSFANRQLKPGDVLETMPPAGNFYTELNAANNKFYVLFAAGSGITPILSIIKAVLKVEPASRVHLVYGNKDAESAIFKNELDALTGTNTKFKITYVYSRDTSAETQGRINKAKCNEIVTKFELGHADEYFICGPEEMIIAVSEYLGEKGIAKNKIHFELFTTPVNLKSEPVAVTPGNFEGNANVTVIMDGSETNFNLSTKGQSVLDAAIGAGVDAPFSCKGAVCCTCKAKVVEGKAIMDMNYALSEEEVESGYILTCQSHPASAKLVVDFDV